MMKGLPILVGAAVALLTGTVVWTLWDARRPAADALQSEAAGEAASPARGTAMRSQLDESAVAASAAATAVVLPALDCAQPPTAVATVGAAAVAGDAFCAELTQLSGLLRPASPRAHHDQAAALFGQWRDAVLAEAALLADGEPLTDRDTAMGGADLAGAASRTGDAAADPMAAVVAAQLRRRAAIAKLTRLRGDLAVADRDIAEEYQRDGARWQGPASVQVIPYLARCSPNADATTSDLRQKAAAAFAADVVSGKSQPAAAATAHRLESLPAFDLKSGGMEPDLQRAVAALQPGQWSAPVRSRAGWVVAQAAQGPAGQARTLDNVRAEIAQQLTERRKLSEAQRLLVALRSSVAVYELVRW